MLPAKFKESLKNNDTYLIVIIISIILKMLTLFDNVKKITLFNGEYFMVSPLIFVSLIGMYKNRKEKNDIKDSLYMMLLLIFFILLFYFPF